MPLSTLLTGLAATAIMGGLAPARMELPAALQAAEPIKISGIGAGRRGRFAFGGVSGRFERSAERLAFFGALMERRYGKVAFSVSGPRIGEELHARCRFGLGALNLDIVAIDRQPLSYQCLFEQKGADQTGEFELRAEWNGTGGLLGKEARTGQLTINGVKLQLRSVHRLRGTPLCVASPIGYTFEKDGVVIGAVELNGAPVIWPRRGSDPHTRLAVTMGALALGLFWDPAGSLLGHEDS